MNIDLIFPPMKCVNIPELETDFKPDTYEMFLEHSGLLLRLIPEDERTNKMCLIAIKQNGLALEYVPFHLLSAHKCEIAMNQNKLAYKHVPKKLRTKKLKQIAYVSFFGYSKHYGDPLGGRTSLFVKIIRHFSGMARWFK